MSTAKRKLLYIEWMDHYSPVHMNWVSLAPDKSDGMPAFSVGWLVDETETTISLMPHIIPSESTGCGRLTILKVAIVKQKILRGYEQ